MKIRNIIPWSYAISVATLCIAMYSKANQSEMFITLFTSAMLLQPVFAAFAIHELRRSEHFTKGEKADFTILLFCAPLIFGTFYLLKLRKRIVYY